MACDGHGTGSHLVEATDDADVAEECGALLAGHYGLAVHLAVSVRVVGWLAGWLERSGMG